MKKLSRFLLVVTTAALLASCDMSSIFGGGGKSSSGGGKTSSGGNSQASSVVIDSSVYGGSVEKKAYAVGVDIPAGEYVVKRANLDEPGEFGVYKSSAEDPRNLYFGSEFKSTSMCDLKAGQYVYATNCTFQNLNSNPEVTDIKDGIFKVGTHFQKNDAGLIVLKKLPDVRHGMWVLYEKLEANSYLINDEVGNNNVGGTDTDLVETIAGVPNGAYIALTGMEVVLS